MTIQPRRVRSTGKLASSAVVIAGSCLLIGSWVVLYWWQLLSTEALLVPWYCCDLGALPALGTWQRAVNDFFAALPGSILPSVAIVTTGVAIFGVRMRRAENRVWLPLAFFLANVLLLAADLLMTQLSWALSNRLVGPRVGGIDAGYDRTWYGIVSHLMLYSVFFLALAKAGFPRRWQGMSSHLAPSRPSET